MPRRLSRGLLAQQSSELAPVRLAAIEGNAGLFPVAGRGSDRTGKSPGRCAILALRYAGLANALASNSKGGVARRGKMVVILREPARLQFTSRRLRSRSAVGVSEGAIIGTPSCFPPTLAASRGPGRRDWNSER